MDGRRTASEWSDLMERYAAAMAEAREAQERNWAAQEQIQETLRQVRAARTVRNGKHAAAGRSPF